jgi:CubicO group peptidase (beta-lactamase class C family)
VSAAVVRRGEVIWTDVIGLANVEDGLEATPDTQYRIGSITKTFTAVAIMQLRDDGRLGLDDPLARHLPEARHGDLTIRRLLAHLSGLQREPVGEIWETLEDPAAEQLVEQLALAELVLPPQVAHHYSNLAYALLGEVVARAAGVAYTEWVDERIIGALELARTTWPSAAPFAQGYFVEPYDDTVRREQHVILRGSVSAGQLWSTTGDLCAWARFLAEGRDGVLARATAEEMWFPQVMWDPDAWTLGWGLGLMLLRRGDRIFGGHDGAMPGHLAGVYISRKEGTGAAALTNSSAGANMVVLAAELAEAAIEALPAEPDPWQPGEPAPPEFASALGRWWSEGSELVFVWREGKLQARESTPAREWPPAVFEPEGEDVFRTVSGRERGELLRLVRDEHGTVIRMYWATYPLTRTPEVFGSA